MDRHSQPTAITRRRFLQAAGLAAGATALPPFNGKASAHTLSTHYTPFRLGLLLPQSHLHPQLSSSLAAGLTLGLAQAGAPAHLTVLEVPPVPSAGEEQVRQLAESGSVDLIAGVLGAGSVAALQPVLDSGSIPLIAIEGGANLIGPSEQHDSVFYQSLGYWQANWAMGQWAARQLGRKAFVASSLYESGYDSLQAFQLGFEAAGGTVARTYVSHVGAFDPQALTAAIAETAPDFVYALYSGPQAADFLGAYAAAGLTGRIPLAGSPFLVDEARLPELGDAALGVFSCLSWAPTLATPENQAFTAAFRAAEGRTPDAFAAVGYETAQLIAGALQTAGGDMRDRAAFRKALAGARLASPRGRLEMKANSLSFPLYVREVRRTAVLENQVIAALAPVGPADARLASLRTDLRTGFLNTYLSV
jgi:branched-chain amino acid transport system substrate-binding protein